MRDWVTKSRRMVIPLNTLVISPGLESRELVLKPSRNPDRNTSARHDLLSRVIPNVCSNMRRSTWFSTFEMSHGQHTCMEYAKYNDLLNKALVGGLLKKL